MKYNESSECFSFTEGGSLYHATFQFVENALHNDGVEVYTKVPFRVIDKVGLLRDEAESLDIARESTLRALEANAITDISQMSFF
jgi:hypothetical protein